MSSKQGRIVGVLTFAWILFVASTSASAANILFNAPFDDTSGLSVASATATPLMNGTTQFDGTANGLVNPPPVILLPPSAGEAIFVNIAAMGTDAFASLSLAFFDSSSTFISSVDNALNMFSPGFYGIEMKNVAIPSGSTSFVPVLTLGNAANPGSPWSVTLDDLTVASVPEPAAGLLCLLGFGGIAAARRRKVAHAASDA